MTGTTAIDSSHRAEVDSGLSGGGLLTLGLLIAGATWLSIAHTRVQGGVASVWIANGLLVGVVLLAPRTAWPRALFAGAAAMMLTRGFYGDPVGTSAWLTFANVVECLIVAGGVRHFVLDIREPSALPRLAKVAVGSALMGCAVSAGLAAIWFSFQSAGSFEQVWVTWFSAHLLGMVITATITVTALRLRWRVLGHAGRRLDLAICLLVLVLTCVLVGFQHHLPVLFLAYLPLMLVTYRHGFAGVVSGIGVLAIAGGIGAGFGLGPFDLMESRTATEKSVLLQLFIGAACLLTFPFAVALAERRRLATRMTVSEGRYRLLADHSRDLIVRMDATGRRLYVSPSSRVLLGWEPEEMLAWPGDLVHPEDRERVESQLQVLFEAGGSGVATYRFQKRDGSYIWLEAVAQRVDGVDPPEVVYSGRDVTQRIDAEQALAASREQLEVAVHELERLARFDALTGLANRRHFDESVQEAFARAQRSGRALMLLAMDVDYFKSINDTHGHGVGDAVLRAFASRIQDCAYEVDLPARLGGDEFVVLVEYSPEPEVGAALANRILKAMREPIVVGEHTLAVSVSIGVGIVQPVRACERLLEVADAALYEAKLAGRNTWRQRMESGLADT